MSEKNTVRADRLTRFMTVPAAAFLVLYVLLAFVTTPLCTAMLLPGAIVFLSSYGVFLVAARKRISRFVRMYVTNRFYLNAESASSAATGKALSLGVFLVLVLFVFAGPFSRIASGSLKAHGAFLPVLAFPVLHAVEGGLYGFNEGAGKRSLMIGTDAVRALLTLCLPLISGRLGFLYGKRIDALLLTDDSGAAYCALFAFAALIAIDVALLLFQLIVRIRELGRMRKSKKTKPRYLGEEPAFFKSCGQLMAAVILPCTLTAVTALAFAADAISVSAFALRFFVIPLLLALIISRCFTGACYRLPGLSDEIESGGMSIRFHRLSHRLSITLPFMAALPAALSEPLNTLLWSFPDVNGIPMVFAGSFYSAVLCAFFVFCLLLSLVRRRKQMAVLAAVSLSVCLLVSFPMKRFSSFGLNGLMAVQILSMLLFVAGAYAVMADLIKESRLSFLRMLVKPFLIALVCALAVYPLQEQLIHVIGEAATCVVCGVSAFVLYLVLLSFFRGFEWGDLMSLPFGRELVRFSLRKRKS